MTIEIEAGASQPQCSMKAPHSAWGFLAISHGLSVSSG